MASAPARADLFNTHQDYKGLPVISAAITLRARTYAHEGRCGTISVTSKNLGQTDEFPLPGPGDKVELKERGWFGNYFRAVAQAVLSPRLHSSSPGINVTLDSEVPVASGLASSAAIEVAFASLLNRIFSLGMNRKQIAEAAYKAEREVLGIPCGRLDQYGSALGGLALIENRPPYNAQSLGGKGIHMVVVDTGIKHSTSEIHPVRQREMQKLTEELRELGLNLPESYEGVPWEKFGEKEIAAYSASLGDVSRRRFIFTVRMNLSTSIAISVMTGKAVNQAELPSGLVLGNGGKLELLGAIANYQHELLRDYYEVSTPEVEKIRKAMLDAGCLGAKISGSGLGGAIVGFVRSPQEGAEVVRRAISSGAARGWVSDVAGGEVSRAE